MGWFGVMSTAATPILYGNGGSAARATGGTVAEMTTSRQVKRTIGSPVECRIISHRAAKRDWLTAIGKHYMTRVVSSWYVRGSMKVPPTRNPPVIGVT